MKLHGNLQEDGGTVGYSDTDGNRQSARKSIIPTNLVEQLGRVAPDGRKIKHFRQRPSFFDREATPACDQTEFVPIFEELGRQWTVWRNPAPDQPVQRHLKIVGGSDSGLDPEAVSASFDTCQC